MTTYRCSSLPLITTCPQAAVRVDGEPIVDSGHPAGDLGTEVHRTLANYLLGNCVEEDYRPDDYVDYDEWHRLVEAGKFCWSQLCVWFPQPYQIEATLSFGLLTGHADLLCVVEDEVRVLDWKTGRVQKDHGEQLRGYCWLALQMYPHAESAYGATVWLREREIAAQRYTRAELDTWYRELEGRLLDDRYVVGEHCRFCPRCLTCPARTAQLAQARSSLLGHNGSTSTMTGVQLGELWANAKMLADVAESVLSSIRAEVGARGGHVEIDKGELVITEQERREILFAGGWDVLQEEGVCTPEVREAIKIPKTVVETAVKEKAPRGQKGAAVQQIMDRLEAAGAIKTSVIQKLERRRDSNGNRNATKAIAAESSGIANDRTTA